MIDTPPPRKKRKKLVPPMIRVFLCTCKEKIHINSDISINTPVEIFYFHLVEDAIKEYWMSCYSHKIIQQFLLHYQGVYLT